MAAALRERVLEWCLGEAERYGGEPVPDDRVALYLSGCVRDGVGNLGGWLARKRLKGARVAFCAAARGFAEHQVAVAGERLPPWRAGAREIQRDAVSGLRGQWVPAVDAVLGYRPPPGSVVVYWREAPTSWKGHAETLVEAGPGGFRSIGANERGGRWYLDASLVSYNHPRLLGFVVEDAPGAPDFAAELDLDLPPTALLEDDHLDLDAILARPLELTPSDWAAIRADVKRRVAEWGERDG